MMPPLHPARRDHRLLRAYAFVEIVEDRSRIDQRLVAVEHQRRHPPQRIIGRDLVGVAEGRPRLVIEGDAVKSQRNRDATDEGGVELANEKHGFANLR